MMNTFEMRLDNNSRTKCEVWTRAMGYCRPVTNFNPGKQSEFKERKFFTEARIMETMEAATLELKVA